MIESKLSGGSETGFSNPLLQFSPDGSAQVAVCAWCYPGATVIKFFPALEGFRLNHTICPFCAGKMARK